METKQRAALIAAGLSAGLVLGSIGVAVATPEAADLATEEAQASAWHRPFREAGERLIDIVADVTGLDLEEIFERRGDGESLNEIISAEGADPADVVGRAVEERSEFLDQRVADGDLTEEEAADILAEMPERLSERMDETELPPRRHGDRPGPDIARAIAELTDLEPRDVMERRVDGESFAAIAESAGSSADAVVEAIRAEAETRLSEAVEAGRLTEEQKTEALERLEENLPDVLTSTEDLPARGPRPPRGDGDAPPEDAEFPAPPVAPDSLGI